MGGVVLPADHAAPAHQAVPGDQRARVKTHIWIAKQGLQLDRHSLYEMLQILSVALFEQVPPQQLRTPPPSYSDADLEPHSFSSRERWDTTGRCGPSPKIRANPPFSGSSAVAEDGISADQREQPHVVGAAYSRTLPPIGGEAHDGPAHVIAASTKTLRAGVGRRRGWWFRRA